MSLVVDIRKTYANAERRFTLDMSFTATTQRVVLFGPSGAGKSMTLQAIAGLLSPDEGTITLNGEPLFDAARRIDVPTRERRVAYLFQDYALFPHLNVRQNIAFGHVGAAQPACEDGAAGSRVLAAGVRSRGARGAVSVAIVGRAETARRAGARTGRATADPAARRTVRGARRRHAPAHASRAAELQARLDIPMVLISHDPDDVAAFGDQGRAVERRTRAGDSAARRVADARHLSARGCGRGRQVGA